MEKGDGGVKGKGEGGSEIGGAGGGLGGGRRSGGGGGAGGGKLAKSGSDHKKSATPQGFFHRSSTFNVVGLAEQSNMCFTV